MVDHDRATGGQAHLALEGRFDLRLDLVAREQRHAVFVAFELALVVRHHLADELQRLVKGAFVIDQDLADIRAQVVADRADDDVAFLVDQEGRSTVGGGVFNGRPQLQQVIEVPLQLFVVFADAGSAHDQAHALGDFQLAHGLAQFAAILAFDAARYAAGARVVRHQHQVATSQREEGGQGCALVAALFLLDLDDDFLAFLECFLDARSLARFLRFIGEVAAGDFLHRQEAVAFGAVVDEGGFQAGLDAGDASFVDVGFFQFPAGNFDVEIEKFLAINNGHTQLFRLSCVDQHPFHIVCISAVPGAGLVGEGVAASIFGANRLGP